MRDDFTTNSVFGTSSIGNFIKLFEFLTKAAADPYLVCLMAQFKYYGAEDAVKAAVELVNATRKAVAEEKGSPEDLAKAEEAADNITAARYIFSSLIQGLNPNKILSKMKSVKKKIDGRAVDPEGQAQTLLNLINSFYQKIGTIAGHEFDEDTKNFVEYYKRKT